MGVEVSGDVLKQQQGKTTGKQERIYGIKMTRFLVLLVVRQYWAFRWTLASVRLVVPQLTVSQGVPRFAPSQRLRLKSEDLSPR